MSCVITLLFFSEQGFTQQLAFPTAEGYGKYVTGGRGGKVIEVTNLNSSGAGSLGAAISASGPRTVVFRVSGTIEGNFEIKNGDITIAGQTAPGDGICIKGNLSTSANNIIIRYIRVRWDPAKGEKDGIGGRYCKNIIFDHITASWSTDETMSLYHNENTTVQWCIIAQACPKGETDEHRFGGIWGNNYGSWHHNLIASNASRNVRWASGCGYNDYRNNVIYNWEYENCYGGEANQVGDRRNPPIPHSTINMVANYYKAGPASSSNKRYQIASPSSRGADDKGSWYVSDNYVDGSTTNTNDNWKGISGSNYIKMNAPWNAMPINQQTAQNAYNDVLLKAGCSFPTRDKVDADIIDDVKKGIAKYGKNGIISKPSDVGGWPILNSLPAPTDTDHDGIPDAWEISHNLDPNKASNNEDRDGDGYTNLEEYLGCLVGEFNTCDGGPSIDCAGVENGTASVDQCGVCSGGTTGKTPNATCKDCNGVPNGGAQIDNCGVCTGGNTGKTACVKDCNGVEGGTAYKDDCDICVGGTTGKNPCVVDCNGDVNGTASVDNCGVCTGGNSVNKPCTESLEAEEACTLDGSVDNDNAGFSGSGFANTDNVMGASASWKVTSTSAQTATITFTYANGGTTDRKGDLYITGSKVATVSLLPTGSWTTWRTSTVNVSLSPGLNILELKATTSDGLANLDILHFSEGVSMANCLVTGVEVLDGVDLNVYPNPTHNHVQWNVPTEWTLYNSLGAELAKGKGTEADLSIFTTGIYLLNLNGEFIKVIKE